MPHRGFPHGGRFGPHGGMPLQGLTVPAVLLLLRGRERHGYALRDELEATGLLPDVDFGNLYRTLRRLEMAGLVTSRWEQADDGPGRRVYALTPAGASYLDRVAAALGEFEAVLSRFLALYREGQAP